MPIVKIPLGTSGVADFVNATLSSPFPDGWGLGFPASLPPINITSVAGGGTLGANQFGPSNDWTFAVDGTIGVPVGAALGVYEGVFIFNPGSGTFYKRFTWEVVCMAVELTASVGVSGGDCLVTLVATPLGGVAPYAHTITKTSGDGTLDGNIWTVEGGTGTATFSVTTLDNADGHVVDRGSCEATDTLTITLTGCTGEGPGLTYTRYVCTDGVCTETTQTDPSMGYATALLCAASGCGGTIDPETDCALEGRMRIVDLGEDHYRAILDGLDGVPSGVTPTLTLQQNGVPLTLETGAYSALFNIAYGATATITGFLMAGSCPPLALFARETNSDAPDAGSGGGTGEPIDETVLPSVPAAPFITRNCVSNKLSVNVEAFSLNAATIQIAREGSDTVVHTFTEPGSWDDAAHIATDGTRYKAKACNAFGCSAYSSLSTVPGASSPLVVTWLAPTSGATITSRTLLRFSVADPNEADQDACAPDSVLPCAESGAAPAIKLGTYTLPGTPALVSGTPRNGTYELEIDPFDFSSGSKTLSASALGVGCCRGSANRSVTLAGTLKSGIFYRDILNDVRAGKKTYSLTYGIEVQELAENTARRYWLEVGARSGDTLNGTYLDSDWPSHQPFLLEQGETWDASGARIERAQWEAKVILRLPQSRYTAVRQKWTPQFVLSAFDLNAGSIAKIREFAPGKHMVLTATPARVWVYENDTATLKVDLNDLGFGSATDAAVVGDKCYVISGSRVLAFDLDAGQRALNSGDALEARTPKAIENVGGVPILIYENTGTTPKLAAYDLSFPTPKAIWNLNVPLSRTRAVGDKLYLASTTALYAATATALPTLQHTFSANISAIGDAAVGLSDGQIWQRGTLGWALSETLAGPVSGVTRWTGSAVGEVAPGPPRGAASRSDSAMVSGQRQSGTWFDERALSVPADLSPQTATGISALDFYSLAGDERLLLGTSPDALLFVYQRSLLSTLQGAVAVSTSAAARLIPHWMRALL